MNQEITLLDGKIVSNDIRESIIHELNNIKGTPRMGIILVGDDKASNIYVNSKIKKCEDIGINVSLIKYKSDEVTEDILLDKIDEWNNDSKINGFIVQLPLPEHINKEQVINQICPEKDIDGFTSANIGKVALGLGGFIPATPLGVMELLNYYNIETVGKHCVVVGRSNIVGLPLSILLGNNDMATVTSCHINTEDLSSHTKMADILIVATGVKGLITKEMVKEDVVIIDIGINRTDEGKICGDVNFDEVSDISSYITPVPGGVGPMTIICLIKNLLTAYKLQNNI